MRVLLACAIVFAATALGCPSSPSAVPADAAPPQPATCTNGLKDGAEGDVDCGGLCDRKCAEDKACRVGPDCGSASCGVKVAPQAVDTPPGTPGADPAAPVALGGADAGKANCAAGGCVCLAATGKDLAKNASETDIDCGGPEASKCTFTKACLVASDCLSNDCKSGKCEASASDGSRNGQETDIDCGGGGAAACADGRRCLAASDCRSRSCVGKICQVPTHTDDTTNLDETDADCGGADPIARCGIDKGCLSRTDCAEKFCDATTKKCRKPAINGTQEGDETDIDCGGPSAPPCAVGKNCVKGDDCDSFVCNAGLKCVAPTSSDGKKNGDESDVDCGGTSTGALRCPTGNRCGSDSDCSSAGCDYNKKCAITRSCKEHFGGDTCGVGEIGDANQAHESCCTQLPITRPGGITTRLGKYNVTAGRLRAFIEGVNGDIRGAVSTNSKWTATYSAYTSYLPTDLAGALAQVGPAAQDFEWPQASDMPYFKDRTLWAARGCFNSFGGARTYWQPPGADQSAYPKDALDQKTANCMTKIILAAFCIWDGGDLPLAAELTWAWRGPQDFSWPWGNTPAPPIVDFGPSEYVVHRYNYQYPNCLKIGAESDSACNVPSPGRRPKGYGPFGHAELAGSAFEFVRDAIFYNSGSWERHTPTRNGGTSGTPVQQWNRRYYAIGGRCSYSL
jgi:hypothetical protein